MRIAFRFNDYVFSTLTGAKPFKKFGEAKERFDRLIPEVPHSASASTVPLSRAPAPIIPRARSTVVLVRHLK